MQQLLTYANVVRTFELHSKNFHGKTNILTHTKSVTM